MPFQPQSTVIVLEDVMSAEDVKFYEQLSVPEAPPLGPNNALSEIGE
jgi:hypothetical protein